MDDKYDKTLFAFLDIMGYKEMVLGAGENQLNALELIENLEKVIQSCIRENIDNSGKSIKDLEIKYTIFSDSVCINVRIGEDKEFNDKEQKYSYSYIEECYIRLYCLCRLVASIQMQSLEYGIIFRGAISVGRHYQSGNVTFSSALVKAYIAESKLAKYPRVIFCLESDYNILKALQESMIHSGLVCMDGDLPFIDYMALINSFQFEPEIVSSYLDYHKDIILKGIENNLTEVHVLEKYLWLANYHNFRLRGNKDKRINISWDGTPLEE